MVAPKGEPSCIFCVASRSKSTRQTLTLLKTGSALVMLNRYPYTNGHLMVAPLMHAASLFETPPETLSHVMRLAAEAQRILSETFRPDGFNIGMNFGHVAGAGFAEHYHMHIVPRWSGDVNFMSVTAGTRLVPEDLDATLERLRPKFRRLRKAFPESDE